MFATLFATHADRVCLRDGDRIATYAEVLTLGRTLIAKLPRSRSLVVLRCTLTIEAVAAYVALMVDGHVPLLIEASLSDELTAHIVATYRPAAVIDPLATLTLGDGAPPALHPALALLLTTSGSTGSPKLVRLSATGIAANAASIADYLGLGPDERALLHLPMSYSYGLSVIHSHFAVGASLCLTRSSVMEPGYFEDLIRNAATSIAGVPFHYTALRRLLAKADAPALRTLTQAGGQMDPKLVAFFADWAAHSGRRFVVMYGQTEAGPRIAYLPPERASGAPDAIGVPIPGVTVRLLDEHGHPVAAGQSGEMVVESPGIMLGYANAPDDLALGDAMGGRPATGDIAVLGEDGLLRIVGRSSRIIKVYGLRVNADEVERRLADLGLRAVCFGSDDMLRVLIEGPSDPVAVRQQIVELFSLPPRGIEVRAGDVLDRTASGKLAAAVLAAGWDAAA